MPEVAAPTLADLVAAVDARLRELGWIQPWQDFPFMWSHPEYGVWSHESATDISIRLEQTDQPAAGEGSVTDEQLANVITLERDHGSTRRRT